MQAELNLDPAYPPSRQNIYLRVARPRALIVLKGACTINPSVRQFITNELEIKVEIPALEFSSNLEIMGGALSGSADVLQSTRSLADVDPSVILGPDSVGTLSFTSGSTGIPKGVKGRHYSLTHFFPWMGERFNLGSESKFTMLSGIAHDPIQRDSTFATSRSSRGTQSLIQCSRLCSSVLSFMCQRPMTSAHLDVWQSGWPTVA